MPEEALVIKDDLAIEHDQSPFKAKSGPP